MNEQINNRRRSLIKALLALGFSGPALSGLLQAATQKKILKTIPSSGEQLPAMGVGTSRTFDALHDAELMQQLSQVMQSFFAAPMVRGKQETMSFTSKSRRPRN